MIAHPRVCPLIRQSRVHAVVRKNRDQHERLASRSNFRNAALLAMLEGVVIQGHLINRSIRGFPPPPLLDQYSGPYFAGRCLQSLYP
jgi:hypothetical protein